MWFRGVSWYAFPETPGKSQFAVPFQPPSREHSVKERPHDLFCVLAGMEFKGTSYHVMFSLKHTHSEYRLVMSERYHYIVTKTWHQSLAKIFSTLIPGGGLGPSAASCKRHTSNLLCHRATNTTVSLSQLPPPFCATIVVVILSQLSPKTSTLVLREWQW